MRLALLPLITLFLWPVPERLEAQAAAAGGAPTVAARPADVESIDAIIAALYDVISGPAGQRRDWDRMRSLFVPGARLIPVRVPADGPATPVVVDVEGYIARSGPMLERDGFFEREIGRRSEVFGHIAHVFSTYDSKRTLDDPQPFMRGINSIQLLNDGTRWWIVTVFWDSERPGQPIPPQYIGQR
ncbi:MAG TPA: hypothetical protein VMM18_02395 [Gemmatimonadaceae bacterium]|nr:hypothetical protein [Gemmatimonadaceae bacterium]